MTSPRTVVEVRAATRDADLDGARSLYPELQPRDLVQVSVVKANSKGADFRTRTLRRLADGAFEDLTDHITDGFHTVPEPDVIIQAVVDAIRAVSDGGAAGARFSREDLKLEIERRRGREPVLRTLDTAVLGAEAKKGNLADLLRRFAKAGAIESPRAGPTTIVDLALADPRALSAAQPRAVPPPLAEPKEPVVDPVVADAAPPESAMQHELEV